MVTYIQSQTLGRQWQKDPLNPHVQGNWAMTIRCLQQVGNLMGWIREIVWNEQFSLFNVFLLTTRYLANNNKRRRGDFSGLNFQFLKHNASGNTEGLWYHLFIHPSVRPSIYPSIHSLIHSRSVPLIKYFWTQLSFQVLRLKWRYFPSEIT